MGFLKRLKRLFLPGRGDLEVEDRTSTSNQIYYQAERRVFQSEIEKLEDYLVTAKRRK